MDRRTLVTALCATVIVATIMTSVVPARRVLRIPLASVLRS